MFGLKIYRQLRYLESYCNKRKEYAGRTKINNEIKIDKEFSSAIRLLGVIF